MSDSDSYSDDFDGSDDSDDVKPTQKKPAAKHTSQSIADSIASILNPTKAKDPTPPRQTTTTTTTTAKITTTYPSHPPPTPPQTKVVSPAAAPSPAPAIPASVEVAVVGPGGGAAFVLSDTDSLGDVVSFIEKRISSDAAEGLGGAGLGAGNDLATMTVTYQGKELVDTHQTLRNAGMTGHVTIVLNDLGLKESLKGDALISSVMSLAASVASIVASSGTAKGRVVLSMLRSCIARKELEVRAFYRTICALRAYRHAQVGVAVVEDNHLNIPTTVSLSATQMQSIFVRLQAAVLPSATEFDSIALTMCEVARSHRAVRHINIAAPAGLVVVGDLRGDLSTLNQILRLDGTHADTVYIFNGGLGCSLDGPDSEAASIATILCVSLLTLLAPSHAHITRGCGEVSPHALFHALSIRYGRSAQHVVRFLSSLPVVYVVNKEIAVTHSGVPSRVLQLADEDEVEDHADSFVRNEVSAVGTTLGAYCAERPALCGVRVSGLSLAAFLRANSLRSAITSHTPPKSDGHTVQNIEGFDWYTVWSAPEYLPGLGGSLLFLAVKGDALGVTPIVLKPGLGCEPKRSQWRALRTMAVSLAAEVLAAPCFTESIFAERLLSRKEIVALLSTMVLHEVPWRTIWGVISIALPTEGKVPKGVSHLEEYVAPFTSLLIATRLEAFWMAQWGKRVAPLLGRVLDTALAALPAPHREVLSPSFRISTSKRTLNSLTALALQIIRLEPRIPQATVWLYIAHLCNEGREEGRALEEAVFVLWRIRCEDAVRYQRICSMVGSVGWLQGLGEGEDVGRRGAWETAEAAVRDAGGKDPVGFVEEMVARCGALLCVSPAASYALFSLVRRATPRILALLCSRVDERLSISSKVFIEVVTLCFQAENSAEEVVEVERESHADTAFCNAVRVWDLLEAMLLRAGEVRTAEGFLLKEVSQGLSDMCGCSFTQRVPVVRKKLWKVHPFGASVLSAVAVGVVVLCTAEVHAVERTNLFALRGLQERDIAVVKRHDQNVQHAIDVVDKQRPLCAPQELCQHLSGSVVIKKNFAELKFFKTTNSTPDLILTLSASSPKKVTENVTLLVTVGNMRAPQAVHRASSLTLLAGRGKGVPKLAFEVVSTMHEKRRVHIALPEAPSYTAAAMRVWAFLENIRFGAFSHNIGTQFCHEGSIACPARDRPHLMPLSQIREALRETARYAVFLHKERFAEKMAEEGSTKAIIESVISRCGAKTRGRIETPLSHLQNMTPTEFLDLVTLNATLETVETLPVETPPDTTGDNAEDNDTPQYGRGVHSLAYSLEEADLHLLEEAVLKAERRFSARPHASGITVSDRVSLPDDAGRGPAEVLQVLGEQVVVRFMEDPEHKTETISLEKVRRLSFARVAVLNELGYVEYQRNLLGIRKDHGRYAVGAGGKGTPLHFACIALRVATVKWLLIRGANPSRDTNPIRKGPSQDRKFSLTPAVLCGANAKAAGELGGKVLQESKDAQIALAPLKNAEAAAMKESTAAQKERDDAQKELLDLQDDMAKKRQKQKTSFDDPADEEEEAKLKAALATSARIFKEKEDLEQTRTAETAVINDRLLGLVSQSEHHKQAATLYRSTAKLLDSYLPTHLAKLKKKKQAPTLVAHEMKEGQKCLTSASATHIATALQKNRVVSLNLGGIRVADDDMETMFAHLPANTSLTELNLRACGVSPEGGLVLAKAVTSNKSLLALYLWSNPLGGEAAVSLLEAALFARSLRVLDLTSTGMSEEECVHCEQLCAQHNITVPAPKVISERNLDDFFGSEPNSIRDRPLQEIRENTPSAASFIELRDAGCASCSDLYTTLQRNTSAKNSEPSIPSPQILSTGIPGGTPIVPPLFTPRRLALVEGLRRKGVITATPRKQEIEPWSLKLHVDAVSVKAPGRGMRRGGGTSRSGSEVGEGETLSLSQREAALKAAKTSVAEDNEARLKEMERMESKKAEEEAEKVQKEKEKEEEEKKKKRAVDSDSDSSSTSAGPTSPDAKYRERMKQLELDKLMKEKEDAEEEQDKLLAKQESGMIR